jgi:hypothetical protein
MPSTTGPRTAPASPSIGRSRRRRSVEAGLFAAVWITAGHLLPLSSNGYLLLGIPLSLAFQVIVRRRPPRELFTAGTSRFTVDRRGAAPAVALAVVPGWYAARSLTGHGLGHDRLVRRSHRRSCLRRLRDPRPVRLLSFAVRGLYPAEFRQVAEQISYGRTGLCPVRIIAVRERSMCKPGIRIGHWVKKVMMDRMWQNPNRIHAVQGPIVTLTAVRRRLP